jgi:large subunit ribosomal protein L10
LDNPRAEKVAVVEEVRQHFDDADAAILTEYRGLTVQDLAALRRSLRSDGGEYKIFKNTLVRLAAKQSGLESLDDLLTGPTAITFISGDAAAVAKALRDFSRTNPLLVIKGGVLGDKVIGPRETAALADLPSREVLLSRLAGLMAAPLQQLASLMQALPRNMAYGLVALRDQRADGEPDAVGEPEAVAPEVGEPEAVAPEVGEPEAVAPEVAEPEAVAPEVAVPEAAEAPAQADAEPPTEQAEASAAEDPAVQPEAEAGADNAEPTE